MFFQIRATPQEIRYGQKTIRFSIDIAKLG